MNPAFRFRTRAATGCASGSASAARSPTTPGAWPSCPWAFAIPEREKPETCRRVPSARRFWRERLLGQLSHLRLTLVIGQYALAYHLPSAASSVTAAVQGWRAHWPAVIPLAHPSPRNNLWLRRNPWFGAELLPALRKRVAGVLAGED